MDKAESQIKEEQEHPTALACENSGDPLNVVNCEQMMAQTVERIAMMGRFLSFRGDLLRPWPVIRYGKKRWAADGPENQIFFDENDALLEEGGRIAELYTRQPEASCMQVLHRPARPQRRSQKQGIEYILCKRCGHLKRCPRGHRRVLFGTLCRSGRCRVCENLFREEPCNLLGTRARHIPSESQILD